MFIFGDHPLQKITTLLKKITSNILITHNMYVSWYQWWYIWTKKTNNPKKKIPQNIKDIVLCKGTVQAKGLVDPKSWCLKVVDPNWKSPQLEVTYLTHLWFGGHVNFFTIPKRSRIKSPFWMWERFSTWKVFSSWKVHPQKATILWKKRHRLFGVSNWKKKSYKGGGKWFLPAGSTGVIIQNGVLRGNFSINLGFDMGLALLQWNQTYCWWKNLGCQESCI